jgi:hypothetical protein
MASSLPVRRVLGSRSPLVVLCMLGVDWLQARQSSEPQRQAILVAWRRKVSSHVLSDFQNTQSHAE